MQNSYINSIPKDPMLHILSYLNRHELARMKETSIKFRILGDTKALYSPEIIKLKDKFYEYNNNRIKIEELDQKNQSKKHRVKELIINNQSIMDYLPNKVKFLTAWLSASVNEKFQIQELVQNEIETITKEIVGLDMESSQLLKESTDIYQIYSNKNEELKSQEEEAKTYKTACEKYEKKMINNGHGLKAEQRIFKLIMGLFGGKENYEALPILDLGDRKIGTDFQELKLEDLSAPIMRGTTSDGRNFFVLRYQDGDENINMTVITQYTKLDYNTWVRERGSDLIQYGFLFIEGEVVEETFKELTDVIKTKQGDNNYFIA